MKAVCLGLILLVAGSANAFFRGSGSGSSIFHSYEHEGHSHELSVSLGDAGTADTEYYYQPECCDPCDLLKSRYTQYYQKCGRYLDDTTYNSYVERCNDLMGEEGWEDEVHVLFDEIRLACFHDFAVVITFKCPWEKKNPENKWRVCKDDGNPDEGELCFPDPEECDACLAFLSADSMFYYKCGQYLPNSLLEMWTARCRMECVLYDTYAAILNTVSGFCHRIDPDWIPDLCAPAPVSKDCVLEDGTVLPFGTEGYVTSDCSKRCDCTDPRNPECEDLPDCDDNASCVEDGTGSHQCECNDEYTGDGYTCELINKDCVVGDGTTIPFGTEGYVTSDCLKSCDCIVPQDPECTDMPDCDDNASCVDDGSDSHKCECNTDYTGDGYTCDLIDKDCVLDDGTTLAFGTVGYVTSDCSERCDCTDPQNAECVDLPDCHNDATCVADGSSYKCECNTNFTGDGYTCDPLPKDCVYNGDTISFGTTGYITTGCTHRCNCTIVRTPICEEISCHANATCETQDDGTRMCECVRDPPYIIFTGDGFTCFRTIIPCIDVPPLDVVFLVDTSQSISVKDFQKELAFLKAVASSLDIGENFTHIGVVSFSRSALIDTPLSGDLNTVEVLEAISGMLHQQSDTKTHLGIEHVIEQYEDHGRPDANKAVFILTDGKSTNQFETAMAINKFNDQFPNATVIVLAVDGGDLDRGEIMLLATGTDEDNVIEREDFDELVNDVKTLAKDICLANKTEVENILLMYKPNDPLVWTNDLIGVYDLYDGDDVGLPNCVGKELWLNTNVGNGYITIVFFNGDLEVRLQTDGDDICTQAGTLLAKKKNVADIHDVVHNNWQVTDPNLNGVRSKYF